MHLNEQSGKNILVVEDDAAIRTVNSEVQCCFMSGHTGKYSTKELLDMGAAHVLPKPFVSLKLLTRLLRGMVIAS